MFLAEPERTSSGSSFVCSKSENVLSVIEKCLDNGVGSCLIVEDDQRLVGRISLDDIRRGLRDGTALTDPTVGWHLAATASVPAMRQLRNDTTDEASLQPILDPAGLLTGVRVDRSTEFVQIARPHLTCAEFRSLLDAFLSGWISSKGPYVQKFEDDFSDFVGSRHGIAVANGTVALHLALTALGVGPGDEVIVPDLTFAATINAVLHCGATPVIADIDRHTWSMTLENVVQACTARTKAIIPVHLYGRPAEIGPIADFAAERGVAVVEDCAEAHGARYAGRPVGRFGEVGCFSFYANKIVTTGEGGMCLTDSSELAAMLRRLRDHGMAPGQAYWHDMVGFNYRITNLQAAMGEAQLQRIEGTLKRNAGVAGAYREALHGIQGVRFPPSMPDVYEPVVWLASVLVPADEREAILRAAREANVEMRPFFHPLSVMPPYARYARHCSNSLELAATGINLPTSAAIDDQIVDRVARVFRDVLG